MNKADQQAVGEVAKAILSVGIAWLCIEFPYLFAVPMAGFLILALWVMNK